ncbi:MAG: hypothetical protein HY272_01870 [Gammaproteobacteria bacterium]|nr:hypothetical protein [Gammaproteobacteria bacterium]
MSDQNVIDLPKLSNRGWRYTRTQAPRVQDEFEADVCRGLYLWIDWYDNDYNVGNSPSINASQLPPYEAALDDREEVVRVPLEHFIRAGAMWLLGAHGNNGATLTFENRPQLDAFNNSLDSYASMLERLAQEARNLKINDADLTVAWDEKAWQRTEEGAHQ